MRDLHKTLAFIENKLARGLDDRKPERPAAPSPPKSPIRGWRAPMTTTDAQYPIERVFPKQKESPMAQYTITARAMKVTIPLNAAEVAALPAPDGQTRSRLTISCEGRGYTTDIATKALRKAKATIAANGVDSVFVMVQGKLKGNEIIEAGIVAQVKLTAKGEETKP
jgi:hypothetical protein